MSDYLKIHSQPCECPFCGAARKLQAQSSLAATACSADSMMSTAHIRIYSRCPACHNDTLMINKGRLLCTWHKCSDPTLIDRLGDHSERPPDDYTYASKQATNCAVCGQRKHTPLRNDEMGGYVCLTCIDRELEKLQAANPQNSEIRPGGPDAPN